MQKILILLISSYFLFASNWQNDINKAFKIAKIKNKMVLVFIDAKSCPYCEKMKREVFEDKTVLKSLSKDYVLVEMDITKASKLFPGTYVTPTTYVFAPNKKLLASQVGYENEEFFFWTLGEAERKFKDR